MNYALVTERINSLIEASTSPKFPVLQKENKSFKPDPNKPLPWLRTTLLPAEPTYVSAGRNRQLRYSGLVQIDSFIKANSVTDDPSVDSLVSMFNDYQNRYFVDSSGFTIIIDYAYRGASTTGTDWYQTPVLVRWHSLPVD